MSSNNEIRRNTNAIRAQLRKSINSFYIILGINKKIKAGKLDFLQNEYNRTYQQVETLAIRGGLVDNRQHNADTKNQLRSLLYRDIKAISTYLGVDTRIKHTSPLNLLEPEADRLYNLLNKQFVKNIVVLRNKRLYRLIYRGHNNLVIDTTPQDDPVDNRVSVDFQYQILEFPMEFEQQPTKEYLFNYIGENNLLTSSNGYHYLLKHPDEEVYYHLPFEMLYDADNFILKITKAIERGYDIRELTPDDLDFTTYTINKNTTYHQAVLDIPNYRASFPIDHSVGTNYNYSNENLCGVDMLKYYYDINKNYFPNKSEIEILMEFARIKQLSTDDFGEMRKAIQEEGITSNELIEYVKRYSNNKYRLYILGPDNQVITRYPDSNEHYFDHALIVKTNFSHFYLVMDGDIRRQVVTSNRIEVSRVKNTEISLENAVIVNDWSSFSKALKGGEGGGRIVVVMDDFLLMKKYINEYGLISTSNFYQYTLTEFECPVHNKTIFLRPEYKREKHMLDCLRESQENEHTAIKIPESVFTYKGLNPLGVGLELLKMVVGEIPKSFYNNDCLKEIDSYQVIPKLYEHYIKITSPLGPDYEAYDINKCDSYSLMNLISDIPVYEIHDYIKKYDGGDINDMCMYRLKGCYLYGDKVVVPEGWRSSAFVRYFLERGVITKEHIVDMYQSKTKIDKNLFKTLVEFVYKSLPESYAKIIINSLVGYFGKRKRKVYSGAFCNKEYANAMRYQGYVENQLDTDLFLACKVEKSRLDSDYRPIYISILDRSIIQLYELIVNTVGDDSNRLLGIQRDSVFVSKQKDVVKKAYTVQSFQVEPFQVAMSISPKKSCLDGMFLLERVEYSRLEKLLDSDKLLTKWNNNKYNQILSSRLYENEQEQIKQYKERYNKDLGGVLVKYKKSNNNKDGYNLGRVFPEKSLGLTTMCGKTRNTLIKGRYYDFDLVNAHIDILRNICEKYNISYVELKKYTENRDKYLQDVMEFYKVGRDEAKQLFLRIIFCGSFKGWVRDNRLDKNVVILDFIKRFNEEVIQIGECLSEHNTELYELARKNKEKKGDTNFIGAFLSLYLQEYELRIVETMMIYLWNETSFLGEGAYIEGTYEYDGIKVLKENVDKNGGKDVLLELMNKKTKELTGFSLQWCEKKIGEVLVDLNKDVEALDWMDTNDTTHPLLRTSPDNILSDLGSVSVDEPLPFNNIEDKRRVFEKIGSYRKCMEACFPREQMKKLDGVVRPSGDISVAWDEVGVDYSRDDYLDVVLEEVLKRDRVLVKGQAGSCKTFLACKLVEELKKRGVQYLVCSSTNKAVDNLRQKGVDEALTIDSSLYKNLSENAGDSYTPDYRQEKYKHSKPEFEALVIDEVYNTNNKNMRTIYNLYKKYNVKIYAFGDKQQIPPVEERENYNDKGLVYDYDYSLSFLQMCGGCYVSLPYNEKTARYDVELKEQLDKLDSGSLPALQVLDRGDVERFICFTNKKVDEMNLKMMEQLDGGDVFKLPVSKKGSRSKLKEMKLVEGSPVSPYNNSKNFYNNQDLFYHHQEDNKVCLTDVNGGMMEVDMKDFVNNFVPAYAITAHKAQGSTFKFKYCICEGEKMNRNEFRVAMTRAEKYEDVYVDKALSKLPDEFVYIHELKLEVKTDFKIGYIYKIYSKIDNSRFYIGSTDRNIHQRFQEHIRDTERIKGSVEKTKLDKFHEEMKKNVCEWKVEMIERVAFKNKQELVEVEMRYISMLNPPLNTKLVEKKQKKAVLEVDVKNNDKVKGVSWDEKRKRFDVYVNSSKKKFCVSKYKNDDNTYEEAKELARQEAIKYRLSLK